MPVLYRRIRHRRTRATARDENRRCREPSSRWTARQCPGLAEEPCVRVPSSAGLGILRSAQADDDGSRLAAFSQHDLTGRGLGQAGRLPRQQPAGSPDRAGHSTLGQRGRAAGESDDALAPPLIRNLIVAPDGPGPAGHGNPLLSRGRGAQKAHRLRSPGARPRPPHGGGCQLTRGCHGSEGSPSPLAVDPEWAVAATSCTCDGTRALILLG